jgi:hypothetical protein
MKGSGHRPPARVVRCPNVLAMVHIGTIRLDLASSNRNSPRSNPPSRGTYPSEWNFEGVPGGAKWGTGGGSQQSRGGSDPSGRDDKIAPRARGFCRPRPPVRSRPETGLNAPAGRVERSCTKGRKTGSSARPDTSYRARAHPPPSPVNPGIMG